MEFITTTVPKNFNIFMLGDLHIGSLLFYGEGFNHALQMLDEDYRGSKCNHVIGMGDYCEAIDSSDKRFDTYTIDTGKIRPDLQYDYFEELIRHTRKRWGCLLFGNHEDTHMKHSDYTRRICKNLDIPYGTYSAVITYQLKTGEQLFKVFVTHGRGSINSTADDPIRREANYHLSLKRKFKGKFADCAISAMGHTHRLLVCPPKKTLYMTSEDGEMLQNYKEGEQSASYIHPDHRYYVNTGSFRRTYIRGCSDYAEKAMYDPVELGFPVVVVRNGKIQRIEKEYI